MIYKILTDFEISFSKFGRVQIDNVTNNDACLLLLLGYLYPDYTRGTVIGFKNDTRVRCVGYILNLVARAFFGSNNADLIATFRLDSFERVIVEEEIVLLD